MSGAWSRSTRSAPTCPICGFAADGSGRSSSVSPHRHRIVSAGVDAILGVLPELLEPAEGWALMGGAALAEYYLGHRQSEDLDLFTLADGAVAELADRFAAGASAGVGRVETQ